MARLSLSLLGPLRIRLNGQPITGFAYNKARALLAYLAVEADSPHHRDALVGLLWPELPDTAARTNLRQALANLREAIGDATATPPFLLITRDTIQFNPASDYDPDVAAFVALLAACVTHAHRHLERCRSCAARMEQAIALYRGDFLAGFSVADSAPFEEWQLRHRERLHQRALDALAHLADYHERRGDDERARRNAQRQIELEPWREEAYRQLMRLLARAGQRSAALAQYETCRHILGRDLGVEPEAETTALYERIRDTTSAELAAHRDEARHVQNFPAQTTALIGRESELAELGTLLENPACRLITIVGPGGIGKTRLALAAGTEQAEAFADGAAFVPLQAINSAAFVAPAILGALGVTLQGQREPREQLLDYLRKKELLLVLDNFEQVIGAASLVGNLLAAAPQLTVLITSRSVLRLSGEHGYVVPTLTLPGEHHLRDLTALARVPAVDLFVQRSQMVKADFRLNEENAAAVAAICQRLDGLPLAIELAAARIKLFKPATLLARLDQRLTLLTHGPRDLPARQQTLRATIDWSYNLLEEADKTLFARLGVFVGGWTLEAAEAVCAGVGSWELGAGVAPLTLNSQSPTPVLDGLARLIDHSLVRQDTSAHGENRFVMLETIREYALERLAASGEAEAVRGQHAAYYLALGEAAEPELRGPRQARWTARLELEHNNLRAVLAWSQAAEASDRQAGELGARLAAAVWEFWSRRGSLSEGRRWLEDALSHVAADAAEPEVRRLRARALSAAGNLAVYQGEAAAGRALLEGSLALFQELGDSWGIAYALLNLGASYRLQRDLGQAERMVEQSLATFRSLGDRWGIGWALRFLTAVLIDAAGSVDAQDQSGRALVVMEEGLAHLRAVGDLTGIAIALRVIGWLAAQQGDDRRARVLLAESLALFHEVGTKFGATPALREFARIVAVQGQQRAELERATRLFGAAEVLEDSMPGAWANPYPTAHQHTIAVLRTQLGEATFAAAWAEGRAMTFGQAVTEALEGSEINSASSIATAAPQ